MRDDSGSPTREAPDVHLASEEEQRAAFRNVHEAWGGDMDLDEWVEWRQRWVRHRRAAWWVATVDGQVLSSLGCYPLSMSVNGTVHPAFGFGAVHTVPAARCRGLADALCRQVVVANREAGRHVGLLFSDIPPAYYAKYGFRSVTSRRHGCRQLVELAEIGARMRVTAAEASGELDTLSALYDRSHAEHAVFLARDDEYWRYSLSKRPDDVFLVARDDADEADGYVRLAAGGEYAQVAELAAGSVETAERLWRAAAAWAHDRGASSLWSWEAPPDALAVGHFEHESRESVTMVCALNADASASDDDLSSRCVIHPSDHF